MEERRRPNRSDVNLNPEEAAKVEAATRHHFEELAPKRHTKPQRSDYSSAYTDILSSSSDLPIPENLQFQRLEKDDNQRLVYSGSKIAQEFTETEYYEDLNAIDKHHHTTGTGFIKVDSGQGNGSWLASPDYGSEGVHPSTQGNPATNDWIPAHSDVVHTLGHFHSTQAFSSLSSSSSTGGL